MSNRIISKNKIKELMNGGFFHIFGSSTINKMISFLSTFILVRVLSKKDYGIYSYALNVYSIFYLLNGLGIPSAILQLCSEKESEKDGRKKLYSYGFKLTVVLNIIISAVLIFFALFSSNTMSGSKELIVLFGISIPVISVYELIQIYFRFSFENKKFSYYTMINSFLILCLSVTGAMLGSSKGLCIGRLLGYLITILAGLVIFGFPLDCVLYKGIISAKVKKTLFSIGIISMMNIATGQLLNLIDVAVVANMGEDSLQIAGYKVATIIPDALLFIPASLMIYYFPIFSKNKDNIEWVKNTYHKILFFFGSFNVMVVFISLCLSKVFFRLIFGEQYVTSISIFRVLMTAYFFSATFRKVTGNVLVTQRKLRVNFLIGIIEVLCDIFFNYCFVSKLGSIGAAYATLIISILSSVCSFIYFEIYIRTKDKESI